MLHVDIKRLRLLTGERKTISREHLFSALDDFSRELYAAILPDTTQPSAAEFLKPVIEECPDTIEWTSSDNGTEFTSTPDHAFVARCRGNGTGPQLTRVRRPRTNGNAERGIKTLLDMWQAETILPSRPDRKLGLTRFVNFYSQTACGHRQEDTV